jgi:hypothetical protein
MTSWPAWNQQGLSQFEPDEVKDKFISHFIARDFVAISLVPQDRPDKQPHCDHIWIDGWCALCSLQMRKKRYDLPCLQK